jgi:hypothetical protein
MQCLRQRLISKITKRQITKTLVVVIVMNELLMKTPTTTDAPETYLAWAQFEKDGNIISLLKHAIKMECERNDLDKKLHIAQSENKL